MRFLLRVVLTALISIFSLSAGAEPFPLIKELSEADNQLKEALAVTKPEALPHKEYADAVWRFRLSIGSPIDNDGMLLPSETALLMDPAEIRKQRVALKTNFRDRRILRDLVAAALLDSQVDEAHLRNFQEAVGDFRQAKRVDTTGGLREEEIAELSGLGREIEAFAGFFKVVHGGNDAVLGANLSLPASLVETAPDEDNKKQEWRIYSSKDGKQNIRVHVFVQGFKANTPLSMAGSLLHNEAAKNEVWRKFEYSEITSENFHIESENRASFLDQASGKETAITSLNNSIGWGRNGRIFGFKFSARLDPFPEIARTAPVLPDPEQAEGISGDGKISRNWKRVTKSLWNLMVSDYKELNGWKRVTAEDCANDWTMKGGNWVAVVYATNRKESQKFADYLDKKTGAKDAPAIGEMFTSEPDGSLHFGCVRVWVPDSRKNEYDLRKYIGRVVPAGKEMPNDGLFYSQSSVIERGLALRDDPDDPSDNRELEIVDPVKNVWTKAMLFVHGYNNSFADAALRAAQVASAANFKGRVYLFSWPARDSAYSYLPSLDVAEQSELDLQYFIKVITSGTKSLELDIVAHSMGSQILLRALGNRLSIFDRRDGDERRDRIRLRHVIFAAPDVANAVFERKVPEIRKFAKSVSVFASSCDGVIALSKLLRGNSPRAGGMRGDGKPIELSSESGPVDVFDVTWTSGGRWCLKNLFSYIGSNHSAFAFHNVILEHISRLLSIKSFGRIAPDLVRSSDSNLVYTECRYPRANGREPPRYWVLRIKTDQGDVCGERNSSAMAHEVPR